MKLQICKNCYIPIISINNTTKLKKPLSSLELAPIFTEKSDFSAMFDNVIKSFGVTEIAQINYFNFNSSYNTDDSVNLVSNSENNNQETESTSDLEEVVTEQTSDESNEEGNTERWLYTRKTPTVMAGSRFKYLAPKIKFGYQELVDAIAEAIEKSEKIDGAKVVDKQENIIEENGSAENNGAPLEKGE